MAIYALILDGKVMNTIVWDGPEESPMEFEEGVTYAIMPDGDGNYPSAGWLYNGEIFTAPPLTDEEIAAQAQQKIDNNLAMKSSLIAQATIAIDPLQDAIDLEVATDEEIELLKAWKQYRIAVNRIDGYTEENIVWPAQPS